MDLTTLAVAGMSLIGTLAGTFGGILVSNKLTTYRIEQLEQKVAAHNSLVERTYKLEGQMTEVQHDIRDLKSESCKQKSIEKTKKVPQSLRDRKRA